MTITQLKTLAACTSGEHLLLVTELMELGNLREWSERNREHIRLDTILQLMLDVTEGLSHIHEAGILHRDIKPENILLHCDEENQIHAKVAGISSLPIFLCVCVWFIYSFNS